METFGKSGSRRIVPGACDRVKLIPLLVPRGLVKSRAASSRPPPPPILPLSGVGEKKRYWINGDICITKKTPIWDLFRISFGGVGGLLYSGIGRVPLFT